jgi:transglutaminase-like putative cysteine protease
MLIRLGYDIELEISQQMAVIAVLNVHPSRAMDLLEPDDIQISQRVRRDEYLDTFGNKCTRILAQPGALRFSGSTLIADSRRPDEEGWDAPQIAVDRLPHDTLRFLLASRYCEVDRLSALAWELFANTAPGWPRVLAICQWVKGHITFDYLSAHPWKSALDVYAERKGVCRDFQHLAITLCRAMHIPARYATGYLGDIGVPPVDLPMDFSAWFEVYLGNRWWTLDARHNTPRIGRVLMATGRDAADVAITTSFGVSLLKRFTVVTDEVVEKRSAA